jgi:ribosomal protein S28E/S33
VPIVERTPDDCFEVFRAHVAGLVAATLPTLDPVVVRVAKGEDQPRATLAFIKGPAALGTNVGTLFVDLVQLLGTEREAKHRHRLRTVKYWYRLQETASGDPLIRWEYDSVSLPHCRHHVHLRSARLPVPGGELDLEHLHLPTGWVTIEEVIRFLIADMDVSPPCGVEWQDRVKESERRFYEDFTGKRYKPA